jgi:hypothetical protein
MLRPLAVAALLLLATAWSLCNSTYVFGEFDEANLAALVIHAMDEHALNRDPLITEVGRVYHSLLFTALAALTRWTSLPQAYTMTFVVVRLFFIAAYYYLARVATGDRATALIAAFAVTGFGFFNIAYCLGGFPLLEHTLVPRVAALPIALLALAMTIQRHYLATMGLMVLTTLVHPVTGVNLLGLYIAYTLLSLPKVRWVPFGCSVLLIALVVASISRQSRLDSVRSGLLIDTEWRRIINSSNGVWVFVRQDTAWRLFLRTLAVGSISAFLSRSPRFVSIFLKFLAGGALAVLVQLIGVDLLGFHPLLQACPERATFAVVALSGIGLSLVIHRLLAEKSNLLKAAGLLIFVLVSYRLQPKFLLAALIISWLLLRIRGRLAIISRRAEIAWGSLAALALAAVLVNGRPQHFLRPLLPWGARYRGWEALRTHGQWWDPDKIEVQLWIRQRSQPDETILPIGWKTSGWEIYSKRSCLFNQSFRAYTNYSKDLAKRWAEVEARVEAMQSWAEVVAYARQQGADWVVIQDWSRSFTPTPRRREGDPVPEFSKGAWHVFHVGNGAAHDRSRPSAGYDRQSNRGRPNIDTGGEFYPLLTRPVATRRTGSNGSRRPAAPPTSRRAALRRSPPPSAGAGDAPSTPRCTDIAVTRTVDSLVHASPQCPLGPRTAIGTPRSPARVGPPAAPRDAHAPAAR